MTLLFSRNQPDSNCIATMSLSPALAASHAGPTRLDSSREWQLSPFYLARVASSAIDEVAVLIEPELTAVTSERLQLLIEWANVEQGASLVLHAAVGTATEAGQRRVLLGARRALHRARVLDHDTLGLLRSLLTDAAFGRVQAASEHCARQAELASRFAALYGDVIARHRAELRQLAQHDDLLRGLALGSPTLYANVVRYARSMDALRGSRRDQCERGLLRYLTRRTFKTTPFSTFCTILPGRLVELLERPPIHIAGNRRLRSRLTPTKALLPTILEVLQSDPQTRCHLVLGLARTLHADSGGWVFLQASGLRESVVHIGHEPALDGIVQFLRQVTPCPYADLQRSLTSHDHFDYDDSSAQELLDQFVSLGLLQWQWPVIEGSDDWESALTAVLHPVQSPTADATRRLIAQVSRVRQHLKGACAAQRATLLRDLELIWRSWREAVGCSHVELPTNLIYEDCSADASVQIVNGPAWQEAVSALGHLVALLRRGAWPAEDQGRMRQFFDQRFAATDTVPLLAFYEAFQREVLAGVHPQEPVDHRPIVHPTATRPLALHRERMQLLHRLVQDRIDSAPDATEVSIGAGELERLLGDLPMPSAAPFAHAVFCHVDCESGNQLRLVVPDGVANVGFGKYWSRFLPLMSATCQDDVRQAQTRPAGSIIAEIAHDGDFNANLHPVLLSRHIEYPTRGHRVPGPAIRATDLLVARDPACATHLELRLRADGVRVWPVDLGFLNPDLRPTLFRMLAKFQPPAHAAMGLENLEGRFPSGLKRAEAGTQPTHAALKPDASSNDFTASPDLSRVRYTPRIVFDERIVLRRMRWTVPRSCVPTQAVNETDAAFYWRVRAWQGELRLPSAVYVRVKSAVSHASPPLRDGLGQPFEPAPPAQAEPQATLAAQTSHETIRDRAASGDAHGVAATQRSPQLTVGAADRATGPRVRKDDRKPQYLHFDSPLLVSLFSTMAVPPNGELIVEECLPTAASAARWAGRAHHTEVVLQFQPADSREVERWATG